MQLLRAAGLSMILAWAALAQYAPTRSVHGVVKFSDGEPVSGAVVSIENTKTLDIRTYITQKDGTYVFHGLSTDIDYQLKARRNNVSTSSETLSRFNSKQDADVDLTMPAPKG